MKLLRKLLIGIVLLILVTSFVIGGFSYFKASSSTNDLMLSKVEDQLNLRQDLIIEKLDSMERILDIIASDERVIDDLSKGKGSDETMRMFTSIVNDNSDLMSLMSIADKNSLIISVDSNNSNVLGADLSERGYLKEAISSKKTAISDMIISKASGLPVIAVAHPVYIDGNYMGSVISTIDFALITDVIVDTKIAEEGYAYLIDVTGENAGVLVSHPNATYVEEATNLYSFDNEELSEVVDRMISDPSGGGYYTFEGKSKFVEFRQIENWALAITANKSDLEATARNILTVSIIVLVLSLLFSAVVAFIMVKKMIMEPVTELESAMAQAGDGNLDIYVENDSKDEIGNLTRSFMKMIDNIHSVVQAINTASDQVAAGSIQVSDSSMSLSQGATEQASSIEELIATTNQIASQTNGNAENANNAKRIVEETRSHAEEGNQQMVDMLGAMKTINESSNNISNIIKVIDDIAFQTNILALNAAVEAARAGQHGKGFAVVAEEVRNLAARSADAAKETTSLIEGSISNVESGTKIANETADALNEIVSGISKTADLVNEIAIASSEQAIGVQQINQGINQISDVVQTTSATAEETAAASEELSGQADMLKRQVMTFKLRT
jgi:methyl-accepting chemotaxis protein